MAGWLAWTLVIAALLAAVGVTVEALRRRILLRMAVRNATRRPRQTATVIAGLMVGTAIISAALIAGGSAGSAIRGAVYDALGPVDETVRLDTFHFFPDDVVDAFEADPDVGPWFDAMAPNAIWQVSITNERTDLFEPEIQTIGFDPARDAGFRDFSFTDRPDGDGSDLQRGEAYLTEELAEKLEARVGDTVELRYTPPRDPLVPDIEALEGTLTAGVGGGLVPPAVQDLLPADPTSSTHTVSVDRGASSLSVVVGWDPRPAEGLPPTTGLHLRLTDPGGTVYETDAAGSATALPPLWLNVTRDDAGGAIPDGDWTLRISSAAGAQVDYQGAAVVFYPVYDADELRERSRELQDLAAEFQDVVDGLSRFGEPSTHTLQVAAITDGERGDQFDFGTTVFWRLDEAQEALGREGEVNVVKFSNPGTATTGGRATDQAVERLNGTLEDLREQHPDDGAIQNLGIHPVKKDFLQLADEAGQLMTGLILFAGSLTVITGLLLIINIFTMLAEERRSELGMARAVGLSRGDLVRLFLFEGSLYAVAAAAVGALLGIALAGGMVAGLNAIIANLGDGFPPIPFVVRAGDVLVAFAAGALLTFVTIAVASRRIARLNIVRAIRRIDEPEHHVGLLAAVMGVVLGGIGVMATALGWGLPDYAYRFSLQVFGPLAAVVGAAMVLRRYVRRKPLYPASAAVLGLYYTATYFLITKYDNIDEANIVGPIRGVLLTLAVVVLVVYWESATRFLGRTMARFKRMRAVAVPAFSYPQHKRFRTGMTLAMFSVVLLAIGFFSIFGGLFDTDVERQSGGYQIEATTTLAVEDLEDYDRGLVPDGLVTERTELLEFYSPDVGLVTVSGERTGQFTAPPHHHVYGFTEDFVEAGPFRLLWRHDDYATDEEAYRAVLERDDVVIVGYQYSTDEQNQDLSHEVGETLQLHLGDTPRDFTIIGIQDQYHFGGVFLEESRVESLFPSTSAPFYLYRIAEGADDVEAAKLLEQNYRDVGMNADATEVEILEEQETFRQILGAMKLFLGLGLIIGVLSLGIVTSRSVIERRQEIGMLRALGFTKNMIRRIFLTEVTVTLVMAAVIGIACSIVVSYGLWFAIIRELQYPYVVPWGEIGILLGVSYVVALMATVAPIRRAARVAPAEALRYIE